MEQQLYYIKNKDVILGSFVWEDADFPVLTVDYGLPPFISRSLNSWIESRTPPKHRANIRELLGTLGLTSMQSIIDLSNGLSLNDTLWVTTDPSIRWRQVSLFSNPFDEVIAKIAFAGGMCGLRFSTTSPEFGTNGMLAKCWVRNPQGVIQLYKAGTTGASNAGMEPYSEVLAHQVLSRLGYNHVPYKVARYRGKLVSVCDLFTDEQTMFQPIYLKYTFNVLEDLIRFCTRDGIERGLAQHLVFDYLSWNTDRHAGNLGVLLDSDTFKLRGFAPIFDNGCSMLNYWNGRDDLDVYVTNSTPALYGSFKYGARLGKKLLGKEHNVERLIGFKFDREAVPGFPEQRLSAIEQWLQGRVQKFLRM